MNKYDAEMEADARKRIVEWAEGGKCKGPSFFTKTCRNPYASKITGSKGEF